MTEPTPLSRWHQVLRDRDLQGLHALLAEDARFHSPVVHRPQVGRDLVHAYLAAAFAVLGQEGFRYLREVVSGREAVLEFSVTLDGIEVNGVDMIRWNEAGLIEDFKVMVRPLKAIQLLHERMAAMLQQRAAGMSDSSAHRNPAP